MCIEEGRIIKQYQKMITIHKNNNDNFQTGAIDSFSECVTVKEFSLISFEEKWNFKLCA